MNQLDYIEEGLAGGVSGMGGVFVAGLEVACVAAVVRGVAAIGEADRAVVALETGRVTFKSASSGADAPSDSAGAGLSSLKICINVVRLSKYAHTKPETPIAPTMAIAKTLELGTGASAGAKVSPSRLVKCAI